MERRLVLRMGQQSVRTQANKSELALRTDYYANSGVAELPGHRHQGIDEWSPFSEVLLEEQSQ